MGQINPFTGTVPLQSSREAADRFRRSLASKQSSSETAAEEIIGSPDAVVSIGGDQSHQSPDKHHEPKEEAADPDDEDETPPRLDISA